MKKKKKQNTEKWGEVCIAKRDRGFHCDESEEVAYHSRKSLKNISTILK